MIAIGITLVMMMTTTTTTEKCFYNALENGLECALRSKEFKKKKRNNVTDDECLCATHSKTTKATAVAAIFFLLLHRIDIATKSKETKEPRGKTSRHLCNGWEVMKLTIAREIWRKRVQFTKEFRINSCRMRMTFLLNVKRRNDFSFFMLHV